MLFTFKASKRQRFVKAMQHFMANEDRYVIITYGRDYGAVFKDKARGCGWYIQYEKREMPAV